ncbi:MAG: T9SS type A sorting domain-containing protein [Bacteroidia bacterium]|nr:T9SS type A sorting domain-containing protein [Bacteroidia bacterium]
MKKTRLLPLLVVLLINGLNAQEMLKPLSGNINYFHPELCETTERAQQNTSMAAKTNSTSTFLPFIEDFSYAPTRNYPVINKWTDSTVYVNTGFALAPPSIGVATFDGLNKHGYPYSPTVINLNLSSKADTLTSQPINLSITANSLVLQPADKVGISFYYQAGGKGDYPELTDSLMLDFYMPAQKKWALGRWAKQGINSPNYSDTSFKRVLVWIQDTAFFHDNFQFRFRNYATTCGDFDHWNIDYIYLDRNRDSIADTSYYDIAFAGMPTPFLKDYSAMPHEQFINAEMAPKNSVRIRSNHNQNVPLQYKYNQEYDKVNNLVYNFTPDNDNIKPFIPNGYCNYPGISNPKTNSFPFANINQNFDFEIKHMIALTTGTAIAPQFINSNDTLLQYQRFRNYYAFDDGSAEAAYYVYTTGPGGKMAVKVKLNYPDEILGARIYFDHVGNIPTKQNFTLSVWADSGNGPGTLLLSDTAQAKYINSGLREIPEYSLRGYSQAARTLPAGTYYIGFKQGVANGINVGYDLNLDHRSSLYYDSGSGWTQSQFYGSVMIRPVFGSFDGTVMTVPKNTGIAPGSAISVFPTPSNNQLFVCVEKHAGATAQLLSVTGQVVLQEKLTSDKQELNTATLENGIYYLLIQQNGGQIHSQKIIISH